MPQISRRCLARMTGQPYAKESRMLSHFDTIPECERQTDRRTDRQTDRQTKLLYQYHALVLLC